MLIRSKEYMEKHIFDPNYLKTAKSLSHEPHGDVFFPDDMLERFQAKDSNRNLLKPDFTLKRMVLMGPMGVGKSTLFNKFTDSTTPASETLKTCTTTNSYAAALGPAKHLVIVDTPGTAASDTNGMTVEQALQLRKALVTGEVSQIVIVIAATNNSRAQAYCDQIQALKDIFDCNTFRQDAHGTDIVMTGKLSSPRRTRPFVVVTHRDKMSAHARDHVEDFEKKIRKDFPWVGPVAFIDKDVGLSWLYDTIIACAGYVGENLTNYSIPMIEMFCQFKISFPPVKNEWTEIIESSKQDLNRAAMCVEHHIKELKKLEVTEGTGVSGNYVDKVAPTLDCLMRVIDDIYEKVTQETLAKCYDKSIDELWLEIENEDLLNERFTTMNTIRRYLASVLTPVRKRIISAFPRNGESAVFKKCNNSNCNQVYMKPTGCNYLGKCGLLAGFKQDESHNGTMNLAIQYEYKWTDNVSTSLILSENERKGFYERSAYKMRQMKYSAAQYLPFHHRSEYADDNDISDKDFSKTLNADKEYGCGETLQWDSMVALTQQELVEYGLVPDAIKITSYDPVVDITSMKIEKFLSGIGKNYEAYAEIFHSNGVQTMREALELHEELGDDAFEDFIRNKTHRKIFCMRLQKYEV